MRRRGRGGTSGGKRTRSLVCSRAIVFKRVVPTQLVVDRGDGGRKSLGVGTEQRQGSSGRLLTHYI